MRAILAGLTFGCMLASAACRRDSDAAGAGERLERRPAEAAVALRDDRARRVTLAQPARRIASLSPANTETLFALGCGDRVVLRDRASDHPPAVRRIPFTDPFQLSPEHVAGFRPDLVLLSHAEPSRAVALRRAGVAVAVFDPQTLAGLYRNIDAVGRLCGAARAAHGLVERLRRRVEAVRRRVDRRRPPSVYLELDGADPARPWTAGPGSLADELLSLAGGRNIFTLPFSQPYAQVNAQRVIRADPELIVLAVDRPREAARALRTRPGWDRLTAVRQRRVIDTISADLLSRPGPRLIDGLEALAGMIHPEAG